jgi:O-antigen/teichoic acid export membrane protein
MGDYPGNMDPLDPSGYPELIAEEARDRPAVLRDQAAPRDGLDYAAADDSQRRRAERLKRVKLSLLTSLLIRPISFILPIVTIPLFYRYLGKERYGLYEAIGAMALYIAMTNAGLTLGLINKLTDCQVRGDDEQARRYSSSLTIALAAMMAIGVVVLAVITPLIPWSRIFETQSDLARRETPASFFVASLLMLLGLLSGLTSAIYVAYQETHRNNIWDGAGKLLSLAACFVVVRTNLGIVGVILALSGVQTIVRLINLVDMFAREKPWLSPRLRLFDWRLFKSTAAEGILFFALQMSVVLLFQSDKLVIGIGLSPEDVAGYAILGRVFLTAYGVYMMLLTPLWPASGEAVHRGDIAWVRKSLRVSMLFGCGLMIFVGVVVLIFGQRVLRLLPGSGSAAPTMSSNLVLAVTAMFLMRAWVDCRSIILNAAGVLLPQVSFYGAHALLNLIVAILAVRRWGVEGVAWSTSITALVTVAWGYPWMIRRYIMRPQHAS